VKLRFGSDWRTVIWAFVLFPTVALLPYWWPGLIAWLLPLALYTGFCAGVFAHNHNHCPTFSGRRMNSFYSTWISVFYGYPTFAWIPTHNRNHHALLNRPGDATITWRYSKRNTWAVASTYFFVSAYWQRGLITDFVRRARARSPRLYRQIVVQSVTVIGVHCAALATAVALYGTGRGLLVYGAGFAVPAASGLWGMIFINYIQHVHCDPWSEHNHSRTFTAPIGNWLVFNAGLHTAHHEHPGAHWSALPALHAQIASQIHPDLCQTGVLRFCLRAYALGMVARRFRTSQIGRAAYAVPPAADAVSALS
jgi:fatty acid desaturase